MNPAARDLDALAGSLLASARRAADATADLHGHSIPAFAYDFDAAGALVGRGDCQHCRAAVQVSVERAPDWLRLTLDFSELPDSCGEGREQQPDLIGPERSEGPPLARTEREERRRAGRGHAGNTPARCELSAPDAPASRPATGAAAVRGSEAYGGGRTA